MLPNEQPIDTTPILAQPREFAQRLARVERERAELIETVSRLRAECNDAQAEAWRAQRRGDTYRQRALCLLAQIDAMLAQGTWYQLLTAAKAVELRAELAEADAARLTRFIERKEIALGEFAKYSGLSTGMCLHWRDEFHALRQPAPAGQNGN